jgi:hypothetical protein
MDLDHDFIAEQYKDNLQRQSDKAISTTVE